MKSIWKKVEEKRNLEVEGVSGMTSDIDKNNTIYIFGGKNKKLDTTKQFVAFDLNTRTWEPKKTKFGEKKDLKPEFYNEFLFSNENSNENSQCPSERHLHKSILVEDDLYIYGGVRMKITEPCRNEMYVFDTDKITWRTIKKDYMPQVTFGFTMTSYMNQIYIFGGKSPITNDVYRYSIERESFYLEKCKTKPPPKRSNHVAATIGYSMYVFGGNDEDDEFLNDLWCFNYLSKVWTEIKTSRSPTPRANHACTVVDGKMYIYGGENMIKIFDDVYYFDPNFKSFGFVPTHSNYFGRRNHTLLPGKNSLFSFGGFWNGDYIKFLLEMELPFHCLYFDHLKNSVKLFNVHFHFQ